MDAARHKRDVEQGEAQGIIKANRSLARKLLSLGTMSREEIADLTELSLDQIDELAS